MIEMMMKANPIAKRLRLIDGKYMSYLKNNQRFGWTKFALLTSFMMLMSGCQSLPNSSSANASPRKIATINDQSKTVLTQAIQHTLYRNQDWIAEHQLYFIETADKPSNLSTSQGIVGCQERHDTAFIAQMRQDHLKTYAQVAKLDESKRNIYDSIKRNYLECYNQAEQQAEAQNTQAATTAIPATPITPTINTPVITDTKQDTKNNDPKQTDNQTSIVPQIVNKINTTDTSGKKRTDNETQSVLDDIEPLSELKQTLSILGLNDEKIQSLNNFVATSGKVMTTGNYRPFSGYVALQLDAGFENKNLKYHYRLPMVVNWKSQAVYIKPDVIMPTVALYLDNKMGMSWQDQWYKFYPKTTRQLPLSMTTKNWLLAVKDSMNALPANQFGQVNADALIPNIAYATQKIVTDGTIIHWQQTREQQQAFYRAIIERYITLMQKELAGHNDETNPAWQNYKQKLTHYLDTRLLDPKLPTDKKPQLLGQDMYFVLKQGQVKQIFANHPALLGEKPVQIQTWITFDPVTKTLAKENQPQTLLTLANTIHDGGLQNNVLDGEQEIDRIIKLNKSRRLFGKDPEWLGVLKRLQKDHKNKPADQDY